MNSKIIENKEEWENYLAQIKLKTSFFQSWLWGEFERSLGKKVFRVGFWEGESMVAAAQLVVVKAKRGKFIHIRNGPVTDWTQKSKIPKIFSELKQIARKEKVEYVRMSPHVEYSKEAEQWLKEIGLVRNQTHDVDAEITWILELKQTEDEILAGMRKNTRYSIRKAEKEGVSIEKSTDITDLDIFYEIYTDTVKRQKWHAYSLAYLRSEFEIFSRDGRIKIYTAKYQGKPIASSLFIYYRNEVYYHHSGSLTEFRNIPASYLIQWEAIKDAKNDGYEIYNFFGIARDESSNHPWAGLTFFKKGFGGTEQRWVHGHDLVLSIKYYLTYIYEYLERKKRGY